MIKRIDSFRSDLKDSHVNVLSFAYSMIYLCLSMWFLFQIGHRWNGINTDPDYIHLFNTLNVIEGYPQGNIDNPASTVHLFSSVLFVIVHFIRSQSGQMNDSLVADAIKNPDIYINICSIYYIAIIAVLLFFFSRNLLRKQNETNSFFALGSLFLITPFFSNPSQFSAQPLLIIASIILLGIIYEVQFLKRETNNKMAIVGGFCLALGIFSKFTFIHLFPIVFFLGFNKRQYFSFFCSFILFSCLFGFRLFGEEQRVYYWIKRNLIHTGVYGSNPDFLPEAKVYIDNILFYLKGNIIFNMVLLGMILLFCFNPKYFKSYRLIAIIGLCVISFVLFMAKHRTSSYYFIADFIFIPIFIKFLYDEWLIKKDSFNKIQLPSIIKSITIIGVGILFLIIVNTRVKKFKINLIEYDNIFIMMEKEGILNGTGSGTILASSFYGNWNSGDRYSKVLKELLGNKTFPNIYTGNNVDFGGEKVSELQIGDRIMINKYELEALNKEKYQVIREATNYIIVCKIKD